jgi:hypothetical protein
MRLMLLPDDRLVICFAHVTYHQQRFFSVPTSPQSSDLPHDGSPPRSTVYNIFSKFQREGL